MSHANDNIREARLPLVLVVEDEVFTRLCIVEHLQRCGFAVLQAHNADEAIEQLQDHGSIGAMFSDIQMVGSMDGAALAHWSRRERPDVKVLLTSGRSLPPTVRDWPLLPKPYRPSDVERELRRLIASA
jgi:two-component system, response regulator PdtaR